MTHPYKSLPAERFWSRAVANGFDGVKLIETDAPLLEAGEKVASAGSCFASNVVRFLEPAGFPYVRAEPFHPSFASVADNEYGYAAFSAAYGHIYTTRQMLQLLFRALGRFTPAEDRWREGGKVVDPFRPGLKFQALCDREFDALTKQHLACTLEAIRQADVFIFTLGLTECWASARDGAVYPACPGTIAGTFDPAAHVFINLTSAEVKADLHALLALLREINPKLRVILTVSPVPLVATAGGKHVVAATIYSKSALVAAAVEAARDSDRVTYFPSYEIITGPQAPKSYFEADRRNVSTEGVEAVMGVLLAQCAVKPGAIAPAPAATPAVQSLSAAVAQAECEELAMDRP